MTKRNGAVILSRAMAFGNLHLGVLMMQGLQVVTAVPQQRGSIPQQPRSFLVASTQIQQPEASFVRSPPLDIPSGYNTRPPSPRHTSSTPASVRETVHQQTPCAPSANSHASTCPGSDNGPAGKHSAAPRPAPTLSASLPP